MHFNQNSLQYFNIIKHLIINRSVDWVHRLFIDCMSSNWSELRVDALLKSRVKCRLTQLYFTNLSGFFVSLTNVIWMLSKHIYICSNA
jgi:hypothetical protein